MAVPGRPEQGGLLCFREGRSYTKNCGLARKPARPKDQQESAEDDEP